MGNANQHEYAVCTTDDLNENQIKEFEIKIDENTYKILLAKYENKFYAIGNKCTHFGLPLANGFFYKGRIRCFAHGACFNVKNGDIEDYPGIDCLPSYKVRVDEKTKQVYVQGTQADLELKKRVAIERPLKGKTRINANILVIGSGSAGLQCIETLRQHGYKNEVIFLTKEPYAPYDRTKLSKGLDFTHDKLALRNEDYYKDLHINFYNNKTVQAIDFDAKQVECNDNKFFKYSKLIICTGLQPLKHPKADDNIKGIFTLRSLDDANTAHKYFTEVKSEKQEQKVKVLIIGSSFVALESATYFVDKASVTVLCHRKPFVGQFGDAIAERIHELHESKGVKFLIQPKLEVTQFKANENGRLTSAVLSDGSEVDVDLCMVAIGSRPMTSFLNPAQINLTPNGYIIVDEHMRTSVSDVYAAGDVVHFPRKCIQTPIETDDHINIGHWHMAGSHGKCAANTLVDELKPLKCVPFFWTAQFGKNFRFTGYNEGYDDLVFFEDPDKKNKMKFAAFYIKSNNVVAVCTCDWDPICATVAELMYNNIWIKREHIESDPWGFKSLIN